jgi:DNA-damage-inducible protein J
MAQDTTYQLRIDQQTKLESFAVFRELGMTPAEGLRIFLTKVAKTRSIPFAINIPNAETAQVLAETDAGIGLNRAKDMADLFKQLEI